MGWVFRSNQPRSAEEAMSIRKVMVLIALGGLTLTGPGCDNELLGFNNGSGQRLDTLQGAVSRFNGKTVRIIVGAGNEQVPANVSFSPKADGSAATFQVTGLPAGAKSVLAEIDGQVYTLKLPKSAGGPLSGIIPETNLVSSSFDLGELDIQGGHLTATHNPFASLVDTDLDGTFDYSDSDIDGDGLDNASDPDAFGDYAEYEGWGWTEEAADAWDEDGDGVADWEDSDYTGDEWSSAFEEADPFSDWGDYDFCAEFPDDPSCGGVDCVANPNDPQCSDYCQNNPQDVECYGSFEEYCAANPDAFECTGF